MKKIITVTLLLIFLVAPFGRLNFVRASDSPLISLISPKTNETYKAGDQMIIQWNQINIDKVMIGYKSCDSCLDWIVFNLDVNINDQTGSYIWNIPENFKSGNYKIDIFGYHTGFGGSKDISQEFSIVSNVNNSSNFSEILKPNQLPKEDAYKAIVKIKTFASDRYNFLTQNSEGSGVVIDSSGLVLTNYHVTTMEEDLDETVRDTSYQVCIPSSIDKEPDCSYVAKLVARDKNLDMAILKIEKISGLSNLTSFLYLDLNQSDSTQVGDNAIALGYPTIGGKTITITQGIVSGKLNKYAKDWIKTDAVMSFGSSGGATIDSSGKITGITSGAHSDLNGSLGYVISVSSIIDWFNKNKN